MHATSYTPCFQSNEEVTIYRRNQKAMGRESVGMSILVNICWKRGFKARDINHNSSLRFNENFRESKTSEP